MKPFLLTLLVASLSLAGCASPEHLQANDSAHDGAPRLHPPGRVKVEYSTSFGDGSWLQEPPTEVLLLRREATQKQIGRQLALNAFLLVATRSVGFQTFSKEQLKGIPIPDVQDRSNLQNPVPTTFVNSLERTVNDRVSKDPEFRGKTFQHPIVVGGGFASLVYESLVGESTDYYLRLDLNVYKQRKSASIFNFTPPAIVNCAKRSEGARPLEEWAADSYQPLKTQLEQILAACERKVIAELGTLLAN
ncbi:hypothetical protein [Ramlibacter rhizophilus]|uniref:Lipoprotein n=1 Tax=Ramlibacter rhizophilus TaxID=1781167 RepID=A0A4Z0BG16_9BURK|nr:hypothetical protein [Ramlibacter rhizophilus]TFY97339.1 hypothetical protein EZ242_17585 [Ramlibacter rhizophilus]